MSNSFLCHTRPNNISSSISLNDRSLVRKTNISSRHSFSYNKKIHLLQFPCKLKFGLKFKETSCNQEFCKMSLQKDMLNLKLKKKKNQQPRDNREMENKMKGIVNNVNNWAGFSVFFLTKIVT